jgi:hypothetical protein
MTIGKGKGPIPEPQPEMPKGIDIASPANISEYIAAIGRKGGQIGGKRRIKTKAQRSKIAAKARWKKAYHPR